MMWVTRNTIIFHRHVRPAADRFYSYPFFFTRLSILSTFKLWSRSPLELCQRKGILLQWSRINTELSQATLVWRYAL